MPRTLKSSMLGTGGAGQAGSALELRKKIQELELRLTEPSYVPTQDEESRLAQLRGALEALRKK